MIELSAPKKWCACKVTNDAAKTNGGDGIHCPNVYKWSCDFAGIVGDWWVFSWCLFDSFHYTAMQSTATNSAWRHELNQTRYWNWKHLRTHINYVRLQQTKFWVCATSQKFGDLKPHEIIPDFSKRLFNTTLLDLKQPSNRKKHPNKHVRMLLLSNRLFKLDT